MDALSQLQQRNSAPKLTDPAPSAEQLEQMFQAALRAPDHANLRPWRFLLVQGSARERLGQIFASALAKRSPEADAEAQAKAASKALRAPLIVVVIARISEHPKVPPVEQRLSAGCAAFSLLLAAEAQGYAGIWRTGANAFDPQVMRDLGMAENEEIVGYLYIGTRDGRAKPLPQHNNSDFVQNWTGE